LSEIQVVKFTLFAAMLDDCLKNAFFLLKVALAM